MKNFMITVEKMGCDLASGTMEPDDIFIIKQTKLKAKGIIQAYKKFKKRYPNFKLNLNKVDKLNQFTYRYYIPVDKMDVEGLSSPNIGMAYVLIQQFRFEDNDEKYGEELFYHDGKWI